MAQGNVSLVNLTYESLLAETNHIINRITWNVEYSDGTSGPTQIGMNDDVCLDGALYGYCYSFSYNFVNVPCTVCVPDNDLYTAINGQEAPLTVLSGTHKYTYGTVDDSTFTSTLFTNPVCR